MKDVVVFVELQSSFSYSMYLLRIVYEGLDAKVCQLGKALEFGSSRFSSRRPSYEGIDGDVYAFRGGGGGGNRCTVVVWEI